MIDNNTPFKLPLAVRPIDQERQHPCDFAIYDAENNLIAATSNQVFSEILADIIVANAAVLNVVIDGLAKDVGLEITND